MNDAGQITGFGYLSPGTMYRASGSSVQVIPGFVGDQYQIGTAIDASGGLVGSSLRADNSWTALIYTDAGGLGHLNQLVPAGSDWNLDPVNEGDSLAFTYGTNGRQIVGAGRTGTGFVRGFVLTPGPDGSPGSGVIKQIGMIPRFAANEPNYNVVAHDVNTAGEVVGGVYDWAVAYPYYAFIWVDGTGTVDLNDLIDPASGWRLSVAFAINDHRQVAGFGNLNGQTRAYTMTLPDLSPCPPADTCHGPGIRDLRTGNCPSSFPVLADGTSCSDGNTCTPNDVCHSGSCVGGPLDLVCAVAPAVEGVTTLNGQQVAVFSFNAGAPASINIPYGPQNFLTPPGNDPNNPSASPPPAWFSPGEHRAVFTSPLVNGILSWTLGTQTVTANGSSPVLTLETRPEGPGIEVGGTFFNLLPDHTAELMSSILQTSDTASTPGSTDGAFDVTDDGTATYQVPLWVPDGRAGVKPDLALSYSSKQGDGPLGYGWHLSGLSIISRCPQDFVHEGAPRAIQFSDSDPLCLDGERLALYSGTYNAAGAEYRTEYDEFIKDQATGSRWPGTYRVLGLSVRWHAAELWVLRRQPPGFHGDPTATLQGTRTNVTANGTTTDDPTATTDATSVRLSWALASVRDRYDNEVTYKYWTPPGAAVELLINRIDYTSGPTGSADRSITFDYGDPDSDPPRQDVRKSFVSGLPLQDAHLLRNISMFGPNPTHVR